MSRHKIRHDKERAAAAADNIAALSAWIEKGKRNA